MKNKLTIPLAVVLFLSGPAYSQTLPEPPAIWREVVGVKYQTPKGVGTNPATLSSLDTPGWINLQIAGITDSPLQPRHTRPHIPAFRTTADGRIGMKTLGLVGFAILKPEKVTQAHVTRLEPKSIATDPANSHENSYVLSDAGYKYIRHENNKLDEPIWPATRDNANLIYKNLATDPSPGGYGHWTLYDPTPTGITTTIDTTKCNPKFIGEKDVYDLKVIGSLTRADGSLTSPDGLQFCAIDIKVTVINPKTKDAAIESVVRQAPPIYSPWIPVDDPNAFELNVAADGRLLVLRIGPNKPFRWQKSGNGEVVPKDIGHNIVYSYNPLGLTDLSGFKTIQPITHAPHDTRINASAGSNALGFAHSPFRDVSGNEFSDGAYFDATYPWIDRDAKNLFFTAMKDTFKWRKELNTPTNQYSRYTYTETPGQNAEKEYYEESGATQGVSFMGKWSHGKMVLLDNLLNEIDPLMGPKLYMRDVNLFTRGNSNPADWATRNQLTLGGNRVNSYGHMPLGDSRNSTIIDSLQNSFNYRKNVAPITPRDVVWSMQNPRHSTELAFDDYLDYDAFIIAEMGGLHSPPDEGLSFKHWTGWTQTPISGIPTSGGFTQSVFLQNSACAPSNRWIVPPYGEVIGSGKGRVEPAATGGVHGKGFWMDGEMGLQFPVAAQPTPAKIAGNTWYVGLFVDCRFLNASGERRLLTFPDNSHIVMTAGAKQLKYRTSAGLDVGTVELRPYTATIPSPDNRKSTLPDPGWAHLAWQIRNGGKDVDFLLNGIPHTRKTDFTSPMFQFQAGNMIVGQNQTGTLGYRGWIDDFKVFAHEVDPETACNHAGGTLVGITGAYGSAGVFALEVATYPNATPSSKEAKLQLDKRLTNSGEAFYTNYVNYRDLKKDKDHSQETGDARSILPPGLVSLRQAIHFPEGPIFHDRPRPNSTMNKFCVTCHIADGAPGLTNSALDPRAVNAILDIRRQPSQPAPLVFGRIPIGFIDNSKIPGTFPTVAETAPANGKNIDVWMQPKFTSVAVKTFTLVDETDPTKPFDVVEIRGNNPTIKCNANKTYKVRVNLDSAQGLVTVKHAVGTFPTDNYPNYEFPYTVPFRNETGAHTLEADPELTGLTRILTFNVIR